MESVQTQTRTLLLIVLRALGLGVVVFSLAIGAQWVVYARILDQPGGMRLISPLIAALSTGLFSVRWQIEQRDESLATLKRCRLIGEMNHHIRNALQVIAWGPYYGLDDRTANISEAVKRIEWTLREVLPEVNLEGDGLPRAAAVTPGRRLRHLG
jgi:hypothetical protein